MATRARSRMEKTLVLAGTGREMGPRALLAVGSIGAAIKFLFFFSDCLNTLMRCLTKLVPTLLQNSVVQGLLKKQRKKFHCKKNQTISSIFNSNLQQNSHSWWCANLPRDKPCRNDMGLVLGIVLVETPPPLSVGPRSEIPLSSLMLSSISRICSWRMLSLLSGIKYLRTSARAKAMRAWASAGGASVVISTCKSSCKCANFGSSDFRHSSSCKHTSDGRESNKLQGNKRRGLVFHLHSRILYRVLYYKVLW